MAATPYALALGDTRPVVADTLEPHQQPTPRAFQQACDFRAQCLIKHPLRSEFHSLAEYLHAGLLEGDPTVVSYVPQPFRLRIGRRRYTPDCYVLRTDGAREVRELKPDGEMDDALRLPLTAFFAQHGMAFHVISNESMFERRTEAENWLEIARSLHIACDLDTAAAEQAVLALLEEQGPCPLDTLVDPGDRARTYDQEIAVFRLLHRGVLKADLTTRPLDWDSELQLCD